MPNEPRRAQIKFAEHLQRMRREVERQSAEIQARSIRVQELREQLWARMDAGRVTVSTGSTSAPPLDVALRDAVDLLARLHPDRVACSLQPARGDQSGPH